MSATVLNPESAEPMMEINTTPLIDVMLVLLIMFIITIPMQTPRGEARPSGQPAEPDSAAGRPGQEQDRDHAERHRPWNSAPVDLVTLRQYLDITTTMTPTPELHLQPHPEARYELVDEVLAITKRAQVTAMGFVGNEAYTSW